MDQLYINWKYNGKIVLTTNETDYHCSIDSVKVRKRSDEIVLNFRPKRPEIPPKELLIKPISGVEKVEVWTASGKYHQHDIIIPNELFVKE